MGGYDSGSGSQDGRDEEDDEEEYEEVGGGNRFLGFMFGNVDNSGDLDADYLDEDAKEHLGALADKLGTSLPDIDLSEKSPRSSADAAEQDYDEKAENAVDYEDINEQYDGPEVQASSEEEYLLPDKQYISSDVSLSTAEHKMSIFGDENYDEDEEEEDGKQVVIVETKPEALMKASVFDHENFDKDGKMEAEKAHLVMDIQPELQNRTSVFDDENYDEDVDEVKGEGETVDKGLETGTEISDQQDAVVFTEGTKSPGDDMQVGSPDMQDMDIEMQNKEEIDDKQPRLDGKGPIPLPILCVEEGMVILRFSEIFGIHEPLKRRGKRDHRYSVFKDRYKSMDATYNVEEDEEEILKCSSHVFPSHQNVDESTVLGGDDDLERLDFSDPLEPAQESDLNVHHRKVKYLSAEPLNKDFDTDIAERCQSTLCSNFYPLDQQDWEEKILWGNSPTTSDNNTESCDTPLNDLRMSSPRESDECAGPENICSKLPSDFDACNHNVIVHSGPIVLESLSRADSSQPGQLPLSESKYHPQLLRLESRMGVDEYNPTDSTKVVNNVEVCQSDLLRRLSKLTSLNGDIAEGSWLNEIIWEPEKNSLKPKLILDLQDEQMLFELLEDKENKNLHLHAGAMIITRSVKPEVPHELTGHGNETGWQFNIANDNFYMNRKISQQLQSNSNKRTTYGIKVHHSAPAIKLQTMKLKLSNKDLANFHRPKALWYPHDSEVIVKQQEKLPTVGPMKVLMKSLGGKGSKLHVNAEETVSSVKMKASKKLDFKEPEQVKVFYLGKELEDSKSLAAQNVRPNSLLHLVRTKIQVMPNAQKIPGANKSLRPPGAFKKKSDLFVKDGHVFLMEYCEERPLLLSNIGMGANLCTYYQKSSPGDQNGNLLRSSPETLGNVVTLEPSDKSPFLGDIKPGSSQSSLETNLYKAPVFPHKVPSTDYLLVRSAKGRLSIRRYDRIAVVGQQEPLMEVLTPGSKNHQAYLLNRLLVYVYREFRDAEKSGAVPWIRADELSAQFPNLTDTILRKKLKECALLRRDAQGHLFWSKKRDFSIPSEEELKKLVLPEHVCAYESMQAGLYRLKHLGITRLTLPTSVSAAVSQLPDEAIALAAASHIERELQITPWSLSSNFVSCTNQDRENIERLEITGVGDPSGRGLGFSYVRATTKAPVSNAMMKKKATAGRGTTVTGTDADLRRLSMDAAKEVLLKFNVPEEQIAKQTRWHRIAMIRKLSSEQAEMGVKVDPTTINKYARGQRMSYLQLQQQTREKCQEIWERQVQSLSAVDGDEFESDSEANSDLDSFAGDLENLLDAEECEGDVSNNEAKHDKSDSVKGIKMRRHPSQAQAEEEIEDEAAEAAELCRLLMDDDEADLKKKKKKEKVVGVESRFIHGLKPNVIDHAQRAKLMKKPKSDILPFTPKESNRRDSEMEIFSGKRKMSEKAKPIKSNVAFTSTPIKAKVKILGDGLKVFKEKKSSRESFVCGACGQLGHMRTNKHCPKYREDPEAQAENNTLEKPSGIESANKSQPKLLKKKTPKISAGIEGLDDETSGLKVKSLPVKFKCSEKSSEKIADGTGQSSEQPTTSDVQPAASDVDVVTRPTSKVNKIKISNRAKPDDGQSDSLKPSIVIRPPADAQRSHVESHKPSIIIKPPTNTDRDYAESSKPSILIRPPGGKDKAPSQKKLVIRRSKDVIDLDQVSQDGSTGSEYQKTKKIVELAALDMPFKHGNMRFGGESARRTTKDEKRYWEEEKKRRNMDRLREERTSGFGPGVAEIKRYEESIRMEREEEERKKAKKKKKKKRVDFNDDYTEDYRSRRNDRRIVERDRGLKRRPVAELGKYVAEAPMAKRRRSGEVDLANILESIVDALRDKKEISYLFLKPVTKKEAPDYFQVIKRPMDLSAIKEKVRKMEYRERDEFRNDVLQINKNAHMYNERRNPGIPPLADRLLEYCDYLLDVHDDSLAEAEASIHAGYY